MNTTPDTMTDTAAWSRFFTDRMRKKSTPVVLLHCLIGLPFAIIWWIAQDTEAAMQVWDERMR